MAMRFPEVRARAAAAEAEQQERQVCKCLALFTVHCSRDSGLQLHQPRCLPWPCVASGSSAARCLHAGTTGCLQVVSVQAQGSLRSAKSMQQLTHVYDQHQTGMRDHIQMSAHATISIVICIYVQVVQCLLQARSQGLLQEKYHQISRGFDAHVTDMKATLTQIVSHPCQQHTFSRSDR